MTGWGDVAGKPCEVCGNPATHIYGAAVICCDCHVGEAGGGVFTREQAEKEHARVSEARAKKPEPIPESER
jgi:hypothetical protein